MGRTRRLRRGERQQALENSRSPSAPWASARRATPSPASCRLASCRASISRSSTAGTSSVTVGPSRLENTRGCAVSFDRQPPADHHHCRAGRQLRPVVECGEHALVEVATEAAFRPDQEQDRPRARVLARSRKKMQEVRRRRLDVVEHAALVADEPGEFPRLHQGQALHRRHDAADFPDPRQPLGELGEAAHGEPPSQSCKPGEPLVPARIQQQWLAVEPGQNLLQGSGQSRRIETIEQPCVEGDQPGELECGRLRAQAFLPRGFRAAAGRAGSWLSVPASSLVPKRVKTSSSRNCR